MIMQALRMQPAIATGQRPDSTVRSVLGIMNVQFGGGIG